MTSHHQRWIMSFPRRGESPKALVVVLGFMGATRRHLEKYADLYNELECTTVSGVADAKAIMRKDDATLREYAKRGLTTATRLLQDHPRIPVVIHIMSNGGAFVWQQMEELLEEATAASLHPHHHHQYHYQYHHDNGNGKNHDYEKNNSNSPDSNGNNNNQTSDDNNMERMASPSTEKTPLHGNTNLDLFRKRLKGQVFDSAPAYSDWKTFVAAFQASGMIKVSQKSKDNSWLMSIIKLLLCVPYLWEKCWYWMTGKQHRMMQFWNHFMECDLVHYQAFVYSTSDHITNASHLEHLIAHRRNRAKQLEQKQEQNNNNNNNNGHAAHHVVSVLKFDDSDHVQHYRKHPQVYGRFIETFLDQVVMDSLT